MTDLKSKIRHVPDFPKPGILFYDVTTLLREPEGFRLAIDQISAPFVDHGITLVVGIESRGFILGAAVADRIGAGFVPVRKLGKLPADCVRATYELEYGTDSLEMHRDAIDQGQRVLIVDDLLATGGTVLGTIDLVEQLKGEVVGLSFLVELGFLNGRERLDGYRIHSVIGY
jgi:adenine phosphoribosyltransferase